MTPRSTRSQKTLDRVTWAIAQTPHMTEAEIRTAIFGEPFSREINATIHKLLQLGRIERHGKGGLGQPYRYTIRERAT